MADWIVFGAACQIDLARAHRYPSGAEIGQVPKCLTGEKLIVEMLDRSVSPGLAWCRRREEPVLWPLPLDALKPWIGRGPEKHTGGRWDNDPGFAVAAVTTDHLEK